MSQYGDSYGAPEPKRTSPWVWAAVGCGGIVLLGVIAVVGLGFWGVQKAKQLGDEMRDPTAREAKVLAALGATELPPGYYPGMAMKIPFVMEMAMLTDEPVVFEDDGGPGLEIDPDSFEGERGFMYFKMPFSDHKQQEMDDFFEGRSDDTDFLEDGGVNVPRGEVLTRGELTAGQARVRYLVQRSTKSYAPAPYGSWSLTNVMMIECPGSKGLQTGLWFSREGLPEQEAAEEMPVEAPEGEATEDEVMAAPEATEPEATEPEATEPEAEAIDLAGTVGDEAMIADFLSYFDFCR